MKHLIAPALLCTLTAHAAPSPLPPLDSVATTLTERRVLTDKWSTLGLLDPRKPSELLALLGLGYGKTQKAAGEGLIDIMLGTSVFHIPRPPAIGPNPTRLARFVHLADVQLADDESPVRVAKLDTPKGVTSSAFRAAEAHGCHLLNSAVRTINALNTSDALDFVMLGGDNIDNAQSNELDWFTSILAGGGGTVECDSGADNTPMGMSDDFFPKAPFTPVGLDVPWYWATGNHDVLVQGNIVVDDKQSGYAVGNVCLLGTRVWEKAGGPVQVGRIVPDERRALLTESALLERVASDREGHGLSSEALRTGRANYVFTRGSVRYIVFDTSSPVGGADGVAINTEVDEFLKPALDAARSDGKYAVVVTHHGTDKLLDPQSVGITSDKALKAMAKRVYSGKRWRALLGEYSNVVMHLAAHTHVNRITQIEPDGGHGYWEVQTSSLVDFPNQMRLIEIHDQDNGYVTISGTAVDVAMQGDDPLGEAALKLAALDVQAGWLKDGSGTALDRNVRLWVRK